jgi:hypothetical protein
LKENKPVELGNYFSIDFSRTFKYENLGLEYLGLILENSKKLMVLDLSCELFPFLLDPPIQFLTPLFVCVCVCADNDFTDELMGVLCPFLETTTTLEYLNISGNQITNQGASALALALKNNPFLRLKEVNMKSKSIVVEGTPGARLTSPFPFPSLFPCLRPF